jgi:hypothetical protein
MHFSKRHFVVRSLTLIVLFVFAALPAFAQPANSGTCNQPMPDPITHIRIDGITQVFPNHRIVQPIFSQDGCWIFVSLNRGADSGGDGIAVFRRDSGRIAHSRFFPIQGLQKALTHDGKTLIVHADLQAALIDVEKLVSGRPDPVLGTIGDQRFDRGRGLMGQMVATSDNKHLFVAQVQTGWISVIDLAKARSGSFNASAIVGGIALEPGERGISLILSSDDRYLYLTADAPANVDWPLVCKNSPNPDRNQPHREGAIWVKIQFVTKRFPFNWGETIWRSRNRP